MCGAVNTLRFYRKKSFFNQKKAIFLGEKAFFFKAEMKIFTFQGAGHNLNNAPGMA